MLSLDVKIFLFSALLAFKHYYQNLLTLYCVRSNSLSLERCLWRSLGKFSTQSK